MRTLALSFSALVLSVFVARAATAQTLTSDLDLPETTMTLGRHFAPAKMVRLQVHHADAVPDLVGSRRLDGRRR